jgi:hypothetical protein
VSFTEASGFTPAACFCSVWMMWYPNADFTSPDVCPGFSAIAAFAYAGSRLAVGISTSSPPLSFVPGSSEYFFASAAKFPPACTCFSTSCALALAAASVAASVPAFDAIRMCRVFTCSSVLYCAA